MGEPGDINGAEMVGEGGEEPGRLAAELLLHVQHWQQVPDLDFVVRPCSCKARTMRVHIHGENRTTCMALQTAERPLMQE